MNFKIINLNHETLYYKIKRYYLDRNDREEKYELIPVQIPYNDIDSIILDDDGTVHFNYTYKDNVTYEKLIKWIKDEGVDLQPNGTLTIDYNTGERDTYQKFLTWITSVTLEENGQFRITYNNNNIPTYEKTLIWVRDITIDADGTTVIHYNTGDRRVH